MPAPAALSVSLTLSVVLRLYCSIGVLPMRVPVPAQKAERIAFRLLAVVCDYFESVYWSVYFSTIFWLMGK